MVVRKGSDYIYFAFIPAEPDVDVGEAYEIIEVSKDWDYEDAREYLEDYLGDGCVVL